MAAFDFVPIFRKVNSVTKPDCHPLLRIDDCIDQTGSAQFVSKFDLLEGYWQVPLSKHAPKPDCHPLLRIDDCIDQTGSAQFVSKFDLLEGYWQVPLSKHAQEISAFVTPDGLYQYTVMPFGMQTTPATFQRMINLVVSGLEGYAAYIDDAVIYSHSWEQHLSQLFHPTERS